MIRLVVGAQGQVPDFGAVLNAKATTIPRCATDV